MKNIWLLVLTFFPVLLSGCATSQTPVFISSEEQGVEVTAIQEEDFWHLDIEDSGYQPVYASHCMNWSKDGMTAQFCVSPIALADHETWEYVTDADAGLEYFGRARIISDNGTDYELMKNEILWDGKDGGGCISACKLRWQDGKCEYLLKAEINSAGSEFDALNFVCPETAQVLEERDYNYFALFKPAGEEWHLSLTSANSMAVLQIYSSPADTEVFNQTTFDRKNVLSGNSSFQYYYYDETTASDMRTITYMWNTSAGLFIFSETVSGMYQTDLIDDYTYLDSNTMLSITKQLGANLLPMSNTTG